MNTEERTPASHGRKAAQVRERFQQRLRAALVAVDRPFCPRASLRIDHVLWRLDRLGVFASATASGA